MFAQLPSGLDRNFVLGHYLPAVVLVGLGTMLASWAGAVPRNVWTDFIVDRLGLALAVGGIAALLIAATFSALNQGMLALMKGDFVQAEQQGPAARAGRLAGKIAFFESRAKRHGAEYERLIEREKDLKARRKALAHDDDEYGKLLRQQIGVAYTRARCYPYDPDRILPTRFGNVVRAFEDYSYTLYYLDPAIAWPRLEMVMDPDARHLVEGVKAQVDLMINLIWVWLILSAEAVGLLTWMWIAGRMGVGPGVGIATTGMVGLVLIWALTLLATGAASRWGEAVMAAFDTHLPKLRDQIDLTSGPAAMAEWQELYELSRDWEYRAREAPPSMRPGVKGEPVQEEPASAEPVVAIAGSAMEAGPNS